MKINMFAFIVGFIVMTVLLIGGMNPDDIITWLVFTLIGIPIIIIIRKCKGN